MLLSYRWNGIPVCQVSGDTVYSVIDPTYKSQGLFASVSGLYPSLGIRLFPCQQIVFLSAYEVQGAILAIGHLVTLGRQIINK